MQGEVLDNSNSTKSLGCALLNSRNREEGTDSSVHRLMPHKPWRMETVCGWSISDAMDDLIGCADFAVRLRIPRSTDRSLTTNPSTSRKEIVTPYNVCRNASSAARSSSDNARNASRTPTASPSCISMASSMVSANPLCRYGCV